MARSRIAGLVATCHASRFVIDGRTDYFARHSGVHIGGGDSVGANENSTAVSRMLRRGLCRADCRADRLEPLLQSGAPIRCALGPHPIQPMAIGYLFTAHV